MKVLLIIIDYWLIDFQSCRHWTRTMGNTLPSVSQMNKQLQYKPQACVVGAYSVSLLIILRYRGPKRVSSYSCVSVDRCTDTSATVAVVHLTSSRRCCPVTVRSRSVHRRRRAVGLCRRARPTRTCAAPRRSTVNARSPSSESASSAATSSRPATGTGSCATCRWKPAEDIAFSSLTRLPCRLLTAPLHRLFASLLHI